MVAASLRPGNGKGSDYWQFNSSELLTAFTDWQKATADIAFTETQLTQTKQLADARVNAQQKLVDRMKRLVEVGTDTENALAAAEADLIEFQIQGRKDIHEAETAVRLARRTEAATAKQLQQAGVDGYYRLTSRSNRELEDGRLIFPNLTENSYIRKMLASQFTVINTLPHAIKELAALPGKHQVWAVGERVHARLADASLQLMDLFTVPSSVQTITPLVGLILVESEARHSKGEVTELHLFHNRPVAGASYAPVGQRLLPLDEEWRRNLAKRPWPTRSLPEVMGNGTATMGALIREYLFVSLFRACAESLASENASRLAAMQRADKNIDELLEDLQKTFHRLRQSGIDEELFDVISGFEALSVEEKGRG